MTQHYVKSEIRRRQIAAAALEIIAEHGLDRFRGKLVAERIGITDGTVFKHFKDKSEIIAAVLDLLEAEMLELQSGLTDLPPAARLRQLFIHRANLLAGPRAVGRLLFSDQLVRLAGAAGKERVMGWQRGANLYITASLKQLQDRKQIRTDLPPEVLARMFIGFLMTFSQELFRPAPAELETVVQQTWRQVAALLVLKEE